MEAVEVNLDERHRLTVPANIRKLLDGRTGDKCELYLVEPSEGKVIADSLIIVNLGKRERMSDQEVPLDSPED